MEGFFVVGTPSFVVLFPGEHISDLMPLMVDVVHDERVDALPIISARAGESQRARFELFQVDEVRRFDAGLGPDLDEPG